MKLFICCFFFFFFFFFSSGRLFFVALSEEAATTFEVFFFFFLLQRFPLQKMLSLLQPLAARTSTRCHPTAFRAAKRRRGKKFRERFFWGAFCAVAVDTFLGLGLFFFFIATVTQKCDIFFGLRCDRDLPSSPMPFRFSLLRTGFSQFLTKAVQRLRWCAVAEWSRAEKKNN